MCPKVRIRRAHDPARNVPVTASRLTPTPFAPCSGAGPAQQPTGVVDALKTVARRIRTFPEGQYVPSPRPQLLDRLTDELLVTASDVAKSVAAEAPPISGNSALRLLAWTVADARGATLVLEKPLALTVGKRLDRQAGSVRAQLAGIRERAEALRSSLRANARGHALTTGLANADADEMTVLNAVHGEVYIGFHELESLIPTPACDGPGAPASPASSASLASPDSAPTHPKPMDSPTTAFDSHLKSMGCYFPWSLVEDYMYDKPECSIPPDVTKALGPEAAEELEARYGPSSKEPLQLEGEAWWLRGVPCFIKVLLLERRLEKEYSEKMLANAQQQCAAVQKERDEAWDRVAEVEAENEKLHLMLRESKGKELALHDVINWHLTRRQR